MRWWQRILWDLGEASLWELYILEGRPLPIVTFQFVDAEGTVLTGPALAPTLLKMQAAMMP